MIGKCGTHLIKLFRQQTQFILSFDSYGMLKITASHNLYFIAKEINVADRFANPKQYNSDKQDAGENDCSNCDPSVQYIAFITVNTDFGRTVCEMQFIIGIPAVPGCLDVFVDQWILVAVT